MRPISIESTLLLFLLIQKFLGGTEKLLQDICVFKHLSIYPYFLLFKSTGVERSSWEIAVPENIYLYTLLFKLEITKFQIKNNCANNSAT